MIYDYTLTTYPNQTNILLIGSLESVLHLTREETKKPIQLDQKIIFPTQATDISRKHGFITQKGSDIRYTHLSTSGAQTWILSEYHQDLDNAPILITEESGNTPELLSRRDKLLIGGDINKNTLDDAFTSDGAYQYALSFTPASIPFFYRLTQDLEYVNNSIARIEANNTLNTCLEQAGWFI